MPGDQISVRSRLPGRLAISALSAFAGALAFGVCGSCCCASTIDKLPELLKQYVRVVHESVSAWQLVARARPVRYHDGLAWLVIERRQESLGDAEVADLVAHGCEVHDQRSPDALAADEAEEVRRVVVVAGHDHIGVPDEVLDDLPVELVVHLPR